MNTYTNRAEPRNTLKPPKASHDPALTRGGQAVKRRRPHWSASLCNAVAGLAGIGQEARHVG